MEGLLKNYPDIEIILNNYAYYLAELDVNLKKALKMINEVVKYNPTAGEMDTKAWVLYKMKRYNDALEAIDQCMDLSDDAEEEPGFVLYDHAGDIYAAAGQIEAAIEFYELALASDLEDVDQEDIEATQAKLEVL